MIHAESLLRIVADELPPKLAKPIKAYFIELDQIERLKYEIKDRRYNILCIEGDLEQIMGKSPADNRARVEPKKMRVLGQIDHAKRTQKNKNRAVAVD